jgi:hypothetical protein
VLKVLVAANIVSCESQGCNKPIIYRPLPFHYWVEDISKVREAICSTKNGRARIPKTVSQSLPKTVGQGYQNRSTKESNIRNPIQGIQNKDLPPTPCQGSEREQEENLESKEPGTPTQRLVLSPHRSEPLDKTTEPDRDEHSAAPIKWTTKSSISSPIEPIIFLQSANPDIQEMHLATLGEELSIYRHSRGPKGINSDFVEFIRQWLTGIRKAEAPLSDALAYITKREPGGSLVAQWPILLEKVREWQEQSRTVLQAATDRQQQSNIPNFPVLPCSQHEKWAEEYLTEGEEAFKQKYPWHEHWFRHLEYCNRILLKKLREESNDRTSF